MNRSRSATTTSKKVITTEFLNLNCIIKSGSITTLHERCMIEYIAMIESIRYACKVIPNLLHFLRPLSNCKTSTNHTSPSIQQSNTTRLRHQDEHDLSKMISFDTAFQSDFVGMILRLLKIVKYLQSFQNVWV